LSGRCSPATGRGEVRQNLGGASNYRPGVIDAMKERPAPEGHRRSDRPAGQAWRHRLRVALWRLEHWPTQTGHVVEECWSVVNLYEEFGSYLQRAQAAVVRALCNAFRGAAPEARESIKWAQPVWEVNARVCSVKALNSYTNVNFWRGAELAERADSEGTAAR
jgi:hypothetical protein